MDAFRPQRMRGVAIVVDRKELQGSLGGYSRRDLHSPKESLLRWPISNDRKTQIREERGIDQDINLILAPLALAEGMRASRPLNFCYFVLNGTEAT